FDMPVCPHFLMELHVSLACAVQNGRYVEYIPQLDEITGSRMQIEDGCAIAPRQPGIGIDGDWDAVAGLSIAEVTGEITAEEKSDAGHGHGAGAEARKGRGICAPACSGLARCARHDLGLQYQELFDLPEAAGKPAVLLFRVPRHRFRSRHGEDGRG